MYKSFWIGIFILFSGFQTLYGNTFDARKIFEESIKLFSIPNISFTVHSTIESPYTKEERSFFLAKRSRGKDEFDLLIRFITPAEIKCTAVLVKNKEQSVKRYAYFPALGRVRVIPQRDENKEVLGLGISYNELSKAKGTIKAVEQVRENNQSVYKLLMQYKDIDTYYYIYKRSKLLQKIETFKQGKLIKSVTVKNTMQFEGKTIIQQWSVKDITQDKQVHFQIDEKSITPETSPRLFEQNRLERCLLRSSV